MDTNVGMTNIVAIPGFVLFLFAIAVLILIALLIRKTGAGSNGASTPSSTAAPMAVPRPIVNTTAPAGAGNEVIAVISAAVVAYMDETAPGIQYAITGITPRSNGQENRSRSAWGAAGVSQNTEPF